MASMLVVRGSSAMRSPVQAVGLDFGTTNSAIAIVGSDHTPHLARFRNAALDGSDAETFRSILFFEATEETGEPNPPSRSATRRFAATWRRPGMAG